jgi:hypothetical protein
VTQSAKACNPNPPKPTNATVYALPPRAPPRCHTWQPDRGGFCWNKQPEFSAYRSSDFGLAFLTLLNATHAEWKWDRNNGRLDQIDDYVLLNRGQPKECLDRLGPRAVEGAAVAAEPDQSKGRFPAFSPQTAAAAEAAGLGQQGGGEPQQEDQQEGGDGEQQDAKQQDAKQGSAQQQGGGSKQQAAGGSGGGTGAAVNPFAGLLPFLGGSGSSRAQGP